MKRVSPTERIRADIDELFSSELGPPRSPRRSVAWRHACSCRPRLRPRSPEFLGRDRYARGERTREGSRNGYAPVTVRTTAGSGELARPKL